MEINGVPLHPLVVHAAVVFVPLAALAAILLVVPGWRWLLRWPALVLALGASVAVQLAVVTGQSFKQDRHLDFPLVRTHEAYAHKLQVAMFVLTFVVIVAFWSLGHVTALRNGSDRAARVAVLEKPLLVVLPILAVVVLVLVFLTGDAGAKAVWKA